MPLWSVEMARLAGLKSAALRAQRKAEALANPPTQVQVPLPNPEIIACPEALRVLERLNKLDSLMADAKTDREWDNLSRAYERMFKVWMVLSKTPLPGSLRPSSKPTKSQAPSRAEPIELPPTDQGQV